jgi:hypothetical protein
MAEMTSPDAPASPTATVGRHRCDQPLDGWLAKLMIVIGPSLSRSTGASAMSPKHQALGA